MGKNSTEIASLITTTLNSSSAINTFFSSSNVTVTGTTVSAVVATTVVNPPSGTTTGGSATISQASTGSNPNINTVSATTGVPFNAAEKLGMEQSSLFLLSVILILLSLGMNARLAVMILSLCSLVCLL